MSELKVDKVSPRSGTALEIGDSGDIITLPAGSVTEKGADIASATTLVVGTDGDYFDITGTTAITGMTVTAGRRFTLQFNGAVVLTHHATNLYLPGAANFTTEANDSLTFIATAANQVRWIGYALKDGGSPVSEATYVQFPATAVASADANRLDDYEEGDFEITFTSAGGGTITVNSSYNELAYTKVGRVCHINGTIVLSSVSGPSGDLKINGLPFTALNVDDASGDSGFTVDMRNMASAIDGYVVSYVVEGTTIIYIREGGTTGNGNDLAAHVDAGTTYIVA